MKIYYPSHASRKMVLSWTDAVLYASAIFALSSSSTPGFLLVHFHAAQVDKVMHFIEYGIFGFILVRALGVTFDFGSWKILARNAFLLGFAYALSDEIHQSFVPFRTMSLADAAVDALGLVAGMAGWLPLRFALRKKLVPAEAEV